MLKEQQDLIKFVNERCKEAEQEKRKSLKKLSQNCIRRKKGRSKLVEQNEIKVIDLKKQVDQCNLRICEREHLNSLLENDMIRTFEDGKYVDEMRETFI